MVTPAASNARRTFRIWVFPIPSVLRISDAVAGLITSTWPFCPPSARAFAPWRRHFFADPVDRFTAICILFKLREEICLASLCHLIFCDLPMCSLHKNSRIALPGKAKLPPSTLCSLLSKSGSPGVHPSAGSIGTATRSEVNQVKNRAAFMSEIQEFAFCASA
jgi:hypothetical protein